MTRMPPARLINRIVGLLVLAAHSGVTVLAMPPAQGQQGGTFPIPEGYTGIVIAMANGVMGHSDDIASMDPADFDTFQREVMERTSEEIAQHREEALLFFEQRFGIADADTHPDVLLITGVTQPEANYRVYAIGGMRLPASGWVLQDGAYLLFVTRPDGLTLGGEFAGQHVPAGTALAFGDYKIERLRPNGEAHPRPFFVAFKSAAPMFILEDGTSHLQCELESPDFGRGLAQGFFWFTNGIPFPGLFQANQRIIWTFSDSPLNGL